MVQAQRAAYLPRMANTVITVVPPTWNMQQMQFANIILAIAGVNFNFFNEVEYTDTVDVEEGRGISPYAMGTTTGMYKAQGSLSVQLAQREQFLTLIQSLSPDGNSIYDAVFNVQAQWQVKAAPGQLQNPVFTDELYGCRLIGGGISGSSGPGMMVERYPLNIQLIRRNGRLPLAGLQM